MLSWVVVGALLLLAAGRSGSARRRRRSASAPSADYHATTVAYARAKLNAVTVRGYTGPLADDLHQAWREVAVQLVPGVPYPAWIALGASSEGQRDVVDRAPFPSGWWGVERAFAARVIRTSADHPALSALDDSADWMDSAAAQTLVAGERYRAALASITRAVGDAWGPEAFRADAWSPWEYQVAVAVYSAGDGTTAELLRAVRAELLRTGRWEAFRASPRSRWWTIVAVTAWSVPRLRTQRIAWALIRPRERFECARALSDARGDVSGIAWCAGDPTWSDALDRELSASAFGGREVGS